MSFSFHHARLGLVGIATVALFTAGCNVSDRTGTAKAGSSSTPPVPRVTTVKPERTTVRRTSEQPGQIEANEVTPIHAKLSGYVKKVAFDIGDRVKQGQVMAELFVPEIEADAKQRRAMIDEAIAEKKQAESTVAVSLAGVTSAEAKVSEIAAGIDRSEADVARWQSEFTRIEQLFRERAQTGSLLDETRHKLKAAEASRTEVRAQVKSAQAALAQAQAALEKARSDVSAAASHVEVTRFDAERADAMERYSKITAPFDGVVIRRKIETGQLTTPGTTGDPLFTVARTGTVTISVGVPESEAPFVKMGNAATIRLLAIDGRTFEGKVTRTAWALDASTRTLLTEIDLPNEDDQLRPGLYAYATIIADEHKNVLTIPATAIIKEAGKTYCVVVADDRASRREIKLGLSDGKLTEVVSGISDADQIVEANSASLTEGQKVERIKPVAASPSTQPAPKAKN